MPSKKLSKRPHNDSNSESDSEAQVIPSKKIRKANKKQNINTSNAAIMEKLIEITEQNKKISEKVETVETNVKECRESLTKTLEDFKTQVEGSLTEHSDRLQKLESNVSVIDHEVKIMKLDRDRMLCDMNRINLILLNFAEVNDRDQIYKLRKNVRKPTILCEDIPFHIRQDQKGLKSIKETILAKYPQADVRINFYHRMLLHDNKITTIIHGEKSEKPASQSEIKKLFPEPSYRQPERSINQQQPEDANNSKRPAVAPTVDAQTTGIPKTTATENKGSRGGGRGNNFLGRLNRQAIPSIIGI
ncbi:unnamed protein product [Orchesella dallaii]|uniref:Uncharacterized protein n=1 Tax=Orchesella dallaii TaxID=48710 RepID=A0ABP1R6Q1_9HEXA